ncbi:MAG: (deoxy)nucleoside triphosphate pyrophosphohydrolase [Lentisphaerae bacterium]|nr:(deoxy)nucleoside triphosphate pyrophosphohydrolase [Lentisphaerota bacterium]
MKQQIIDVVAAVIYDCGGRILACQRPQGKPLAGFWEFPGGKVEPGESLGRALQRELQEELALQVTVLDEIYQLTVNTADGNRLLLHFIRALKQPGSEPVSCENQHFQWQAINQLETLDWLESDKEFVRYLMQPYRG